MKKTRSISYVLLLLFIELTQISSFGQYSSLGDTPMFKNGKYNLFRDKVTNNLYDMSVMDSLYQTGKSPFSVISDVRKGDTIIWMIEFIKEEDLSIKPKWLGKDFPLQEFVDINNIQISKNDLNGRVLIINCWSISCGPCLIEMPYLNSLVDSLENKNYAFLGITFDDAGSINEFFKSNRLKEYLNTENPSFNFTIIPDQEVFLSNVLGIKSYPTTFVVGNDGVITGIIEGLYLDDQRNPKVYSDIMDLLENIN